MVFRRTARVAQLVLLALGAAACARHSARAYPAGTVAGFYAAAFEDQSSFRGCDRRTYRIAQASDFWARYRRVYAETPDGQRPPLVFAVLAAKVGPAESAEPPPRATTRALIVTRVHAMRRARGDECARWLADR